MSFDSGNIGLINTQAFTVSIYRTIKHHGTHSRKSSLCSIMAKAIRTQFAGRGSEEHLEGELCSLSCSTLQKVEKACVCKSRRSPVPTLLLSCATQAAELRPPR